MKPLLVAETNSYSVAFLCTKYELWKSLHNSSEEKSFVCLPHKEARFDPCKNMSIRCINRFKGFFQQSNLPAVRTINPPPLTPFVTTVYMYLFQEKPPLAAVLTVGFVWQTLMSFYLFVLFYFSFCWEEIQCCCTHYWRGAGGQFVLVQRCNDTARLVPPQPSERSDLWLCILLRIFKHFMRTQTRLEQTELEPPQKFSLF